MQEENSLRLGETFGAVAPWFIPSWRRKKEEKMFSRSDKSAGPRHRQTGSSQARRALQKWRPALTRGDIPDVFAGERRAT